MEGSGRTRGFYHALALGLYEERGLDVEIIQGNAGINIPRLLAAKEIEFGMGSNSFVPLNMLRCWYTSKSSNGFISERPTNNYDS